MKLLSHTRFILSPGIAFAAPTGGGGTPPRPTPESLTLDQIADALAHVQGDLHMAAQALGTGSARFGAVREILQHMYQRREITHGQRDTIEAARVAEPSVSYGTRTSLNFQEIIDSLGTAEEPLTYLETFFATFFEGARTPHTHALQQVRTALASALAMLTPTEETPHALTHVATAPPASEQRAEAHDEAFTDKGAKRRLNNALFSKTKKKINWQGNVIKT